MGVLTRRALRRQAFTTEETERKKRKREAKVKQGAGRKTKDLILASRFLLRASCFVFLFGRKLYVPAMPYNQPQKPGSF